MRLRMLNGLGGSAASLRSAKISIMCMPSTRPSKIDPTTGVSLDRGHVHTRESVEHDLNDVVTEHAWDIYHSLQRRTCPPMLSR